MPLCPACCVGTSRRWEQGQGRFRHLRAACKARGAHTTSMHCPLIYIYIYPPRGFPVFAETHGPPWRYASRLSAGRDIIWCSRRNSKTGGAGCSTPPLSFDNHKAPQNLTLTQTLQCQPPRWAHQDADPLLLIRGVDLRREEPATCTSLVRRAVGGGHTVQFYCSRRARGRTMATR